MEPSLISVGVLGAYLIALLVAGFAYLRRVRVDRPPIGVFHRRDLLFVVAVLLVMPLVYLRLPGAAIGTVFTLVGLGLLYTVLSAAIGSLPGFIVALIMMGSDVALAILGPREAFLPVNNLLLIVAVLGVANLWVQSGVKAVDVAIFAGVVTVYDLVATLAFPTMMELFTRVQMLPMSPVLAWGDGIGLIGIGLGDLVLIMLWPLVAEKAFSQAAGLVAAVLMVLGVAAMLSVILFDLLNIPLPAMVVLGPIIIGHFLLLRRTRTERTTGAYLGIPAIERPWAHDDIVAGLAFVQSGSTARRYLAIRDGETVGEGRTAAEATRNAGAGSAPLVVLR